MLRLLAAILILLPLPALADVTARYSLGKDVLLVEADDGGNARIGIDGKFSIIRRDGSDYVAMTNAAGETRVAELSELIILFDAAVAEGPKKGSVALEGMKFLLVAKGDASVGTRAGTAWSFGPEKENDGRTGKMLEVVMSDDPALAPVGAVLRRMVETFEPLFGMIASESSGFYAKALDLASKGTPLRIDVVELQAVDTADIDVKRFELPAPVISAVEFMASMEPPQLDIPSLP